MDLTQLRKGDTLWTLNQPKMIKPRVRRPVLMGDCVLGTWRGSGSDRKHYDESRVACVDLETGEKRWEWMDYTLIDRPIITEHGVFLTTLFGTMLMLDVDGGERWKTELRISMSLSQTVVRDIVLVGSYYGEKFLRGLDATTGEVAWYTKTEGTPMFLTPTGDKVVHIEKPDEGDPHAVCRDPRDGSEVWREPLQGWPYGLTAFDDETLVTSTRTQLRTLKADTGRTVGKLAWPDGVSNVRLRGVDGALVLGSADLDQASASLLVDVSRPSKPEIVWSVDDPKPAVAHALTADGVLVWDAAGRLSVRSRETGEEQAMWKPKTGTSKGEAGGLVVHDDVVVAGVGDSLICVRPPEA